MSCIELIVWLVAEHLVVGDDIRECQVGQLFRSSSQVLFLHVYLWVEVRGQSVDRDLHSIVLWVELSILSLGGTRDLEYVELDLLLDAIELEFLVHELVIGLRVLKLEGVVVVVWNELD